MTLHKNAEDPRVVRTRGLIVSAFMELMQSQPFREITIQEIADRATVNRVTFYAHFADKYDLIDQILHDEFREHVAAAFFALPAQEAHLRQLIVAICAFMSRFHQPCHPADQELQPIFETAMQTEIEQVLVVWLRLRLTTWRAERRALCAQVWSWAILGVTSTWSQGDQHQSMETIAAEVSHILLHGIDLPGNT